jgi:anaerobic ribonucleoside-triphosphate reductase activating protein
MSELDPAVEELMQNIDILKDGRYMLEQRDLELKFRGSRNQRLLDMKRSLDEKRAVGAEFA